MEASLASYIDLLTPWIPANLVSESCLNRIRTISTDLPLISFGCFECWLADSEPRVDFNVGITGKLNEHKTIVQWFSGRPEPEHEQQQLALKKLQSICSAWSDSSFFLHAQIKVLWLVYDIPDPLNVTLVPWMYIHFRKNLFMDDGMVRTEIVLQTLSFMDSRYSFEKREAFRSFFQNLSSAVQICSIGAPTNRNSNVLRVYVMMQTYDDLVRVLTDNQWLGDADELQKQIGHLVQYADFFGLSIDIDPIIQPKIGIECWFNEDQAQPKLMNFTRILVDEDVCSPQKREALLSWNGCFNTTINPAVWSWPDNMQPVKPSENKQVVVRKMAQYVKLVYEPDKPLVAKGYLYFNRLLQST